MNIVSIKPVGRKPAYDITVAGNHEYIFKNGVRTHNTGIYYSADNIWIIGRQQDKDDKELLGYHFVINIEKSRFVKEKSKIPITVGFDSGINKWSGLLDLALEGNFILKPRAGWYTRLDPTTGEIIGKNYRAADIVDNGDFWKAIFEETNFAEWIKNKYSLSSTKLIKEDDDE
jgi:hypothetical protein